MNCLLVWFGGCLQFEGCLRGGRGMFTGTKTTITGGEFRVTALGDECSPQSMYTIKRCNA